MADLFNIDTNLIKHNGHEVLLMKLNGHIVYEKETYRIEYTVNPSDDYLDRVNVLSGICEGLPCIYTDEDSYSYRYSKIEVTKLDGSVIYNTDVRCNEISKVIVWYPEDTHKICFHSRTSDGNSTISKINYCNTFNFVDMSSMFRKCKSLTSIDVNNWITSNVTTMYNMFYNCYKLTALDTSKWDTHNVTDMSGMFDGCLSLASLDVSKWNTSNVRTMHSMFYDCNSLTSLDLSNWDTSNVTSMTFMLRGCKSLTELDLSNWDVSNVANMYGIFYDCTKLQSLDLSNWDVSTVAIGEFGLGDMFGSMFENCTSLRELHLENCNNETLKRIINYGDLPTNTIDGVTKTIYCKKSQLSGVTLPDGWVYSYVYEEEPDVPDIPEEPDVPDIPEEPDTSTVPYMEYTVADAYDSKMLGEKYYDKDTGDDGCYGLPRVYTNASNYSYTGYDDIEIVLKDDTIAIEPSYVSIANTSKVKLWFPENTYSIRFSPIYTTSSGSRESSRVNDLTYINYSDGVTDMSYMFQYCTYLTKCNFDCDTSNVTDMSGMFHSCQFLSSLDLSGFNTSNVTNMSGMFNSCTSLATLNLNGWSTNNVTNMSYMLQYCSSLTDLNLSSFDMSKTTNVYNMFYSCSNLTNLDAPRNISASISFSSCKNLTHDSLMSIINNLATISGKTLTLGATNLAKLSEEEKAIATNKGWTLI